jgi:hypothetical protein
MKGKRKCFPHICLETGREGGKEKEKLIFVWFGLVWFVKGKEMERTIYVFHLNAQM